MPKYNKGPKKYPSPEKRPMDISNDILFLDTNKKIKKKHRELIEGLLSIRDKKNLVIKIDDESISISYDKYHNLSTSTKNIGLPINDGESSIHITILKKIGCVTSMGIRSTRFKDKNLYNEIIDLANKSKREVDIETFEDLYSSAILNFDLSRNINLDKILN